MQARSSKPEQPRMRIDLRLIAVVLDS